MTKKTVFLFVLCLLLIISAITGCDTEHEPTNPYPDTTPSITPDTTPSTSPETHPTDPNATYIDLSLYGTWISPDNEVIQSDAVSITVDGTIARNEYDQNIVECQIAFSSDTFEHTCGSATNIADDFETAPYFVCPYQLYSNTSQSQVIPYFALSLEHGYAIFAKADDLGNYLIASKDPETDPQEILDYFQDFIEEYTTSSSEDAA